MNKTSKYPSEIDSRVFFQDINLNQVTSYEQYQNYLSAGNYSSAAYLAEQLDTVVFSAGVLNYFDGKLFNIETEIMRRKAIIDKYAEEARKIAANMYWTYYGSEPTSSLTNNITWIA